MGTKFFGNSLIYEYDNQFQTSEKTQTNSSYTVQNGRPNTHIIHVDLDEEMDNEELEKDQKALKRKNRNRAEIYGTYFYF